MPYRITHHAKQRLQQRGSRARDVTTIMAYGDIEIPARDGCRYVRLSNKAAGALLKLGLASVQDVDRARRLILVVDGADRVVTAIKHDPHSMFLDAARRAKGTR